MTTTCDCDACRALEAEYGADPQLLTFYRRRLLVRGWAGKYRTEAEKAYALKHSTWAQAAADHGTAALSRVRALSRNAAVGAPYGVGVVLPDLDPQNAPPMGVPSGD